MPKTEKTSIKVDVPDEDYALLTKLAQRSRMSIRGWAALILVQAAREGRVIPLPAEEPVSSHGKARPRAQASQAVPSPAES